MAALLDIGVLRTASDAWFDGDVIWFAASRHLQSRELRRADDERRADASTAGRALAKQSQHTGSSPTHVRQERGVPERCGRRAFG
jgi:hypothetical protein